MHALLAPGGRPLRQGITRPAGSQPLGRTGSIPRYVFHDAEPRDIGTVATRVHTPALKVNRVLASPPRTGLT